jgi:Cu-Zn family superoxide dismutase
MSTGGHYNPDKHIHGGPTTSPVHAGDLGNLEADDKGVAKMDLTVDNISLGGAKNDVVGKPVIIHAKEDDYKTQPTGNAGGRIGGGIIEVSK